MKAPFILVLISAVVAAPLFADTITLKNGQTYEGEIIGKTSEYIELKTDSEDLRMQVSECITHRGGRAEAEEVAPVDTSKVVAEAQAAAEAHVNKMLWFGAGCLLTIVGVAVAHFVEPGPPQSHLIGKSPEYIDAFTIAYKKKAKGIRGIECLKGCCISGSLVSFYLLVRFTEWAGSRESTPIGCYW